MVPQGVHGIMCVALRCCDGLDRRVPHRLDVSVRWVVLGLGARFPGVENLMPDKTVADLMHKGIIACRPETAMSEVVRIISEADVHAVVVMDYDEQAVGVISHTDIIRLYGQDLSQHAAREVMSKPPVTIRSDAPARAAADLMLQRGVHRLLVIETEDDAPKPVGIVSTTDLVRDMRGSRWTWYMG